VTPTPQTEVQLLADICLALGGSQAVIAGQTEVTILQNIISALGEIPVQGTEVPLYTQWLAIISPGTLPEQTEVQLLTQILEAYGGTQTGWNEVPLLQDILNFLGGYTPTPPSDDTYLRPGGVFTYFRPGGVFIFLRP
jgi:hypothetical protein